MNSRRNNPKKQRCSSEQRSSLTIELVPAFSWQRNVRAVVASNTWEGLRWYFGATQFPPPDLSIVFPDRPFISKLKCAYCETEQKKLDLHEEWQYDDSRQIQRLVDLRPICSKCHLTKHMGYANTIGRADEALQHLSKVNCWTKRQAKAHSDRAFAVWEARAFTRYTLDLNYLQRYIPSTKIHLNWLESPRTWVGSRLDAILWANRLLDSDAIIMDTETTGLLSKPDVEVIELAAIDMKGGASITVYVSLFTKFRKRL